MSLSKNPKVRKFVRDKLSLVWTTLTNEEREQIIRELDKQLNDKKAKRGEGENSKLLAKFVKANEKQLEKKLNEGKAVIEDEVDVDEEIEDEVDVDEEIEDEVDVDEEIEDEEPNA